MARPRAWGDTLVEFAIASAGVVSTPLNLLTTLSPSDTITVARLIGHLTVLPTSLISTGNHVTNIDMGIGVASIEAFAATAGLPLPSIAADVPIRGWLWRERLTMAHHNDDGTEDSYVKWPEVRFDLGAMRKVDRGVLYFHAIVSLSGGTFVSITVHGLIRAMCIT